jgi:dephospho-CoA kinase
VIRPDGSLDRARLGDIVFADPDARDDLERITHPRITELTGKRIAAAIAGSAPLVAVDIPLLFENAREAMFEGVLLVYAPRAVQIQRLRERNGLDEAAAQQRLAAQLPIDEKRDRATWVIDNSGDLDATSQAVDEWWETAVR